MRTHGIYIVAGVLLCALAFALTDCARIVAPGGGPRDSVPPRIVRCEPIPGSTEVRPEELQITFDEYVKLKSPNRNIYMSPPLKYPVVAVVKGRTVEIRFRDTLADSTTYNLHFGQCIVDLTEGQPMEDFSFAFSTGPTIDSARLFGRVRNALTQRPIAGMNVSIYRQNIDSLPQTTLPDFVARTDSAGIFDIRYIPSGSYKIFGIKNASNKLIYSNTKDTIAFLKELQTTVLPGDTVEAKRIPVLEGFAREVRKHYLLAEKRLVANRISFVFSARPIGGLQATLLDAPDAELVKEQSAKGDTVSYWIMDSAIALRDTIVTRLQYQQTDSTGGLQTRQDTITLPFEFPEKEEEEEELTAAQDSLKVKPQAIAAQQREGDTTQTASRKPTQKEKGWLERTFGTNRTSVELSKKEKQRKIKRMACALVCKRKKVLRPWDTVSISLSSPTTLLERGKVRLLSLPDSTTLEAKVSYEPEVQPRRIAITHEWEPGREYRLRVEPGAVKNLFGRTNDTLKMSLKGLNPSDYSALHITLKNAPEQALIQLLPAGKYRQILRQEHGHSADFIYLDPGTVWIRLIDDANGNGQWDAGDYSLGTEPERVRYYLNELGDRDIIMRPNWEYDIHINYEKLEE
ncbi:MAG: hypothetical protein CSA97_02565 [Bacteroidetes bacterium]|nr:MAG: hypothetical protein CSA97_02565 [Bacteroidota bacterium]